MKILFSAAMNFKMINKTGSVDSRDSLQYSRGVRVINKQKIGPVKMGGSREKVHCQCVLENWFNCKTYGLDLNECFVSLPNLHPPISFLLLSLQNQI